MEPTEWRARLLALIDDMTRVLDELPDDQPVSREQRAVWLAEIRRLGATCPPDWTQP